MTTPMLPATTTTPATTAPRFERVVQEFNRHAITVLGGARTEIATKPEFTEVAVQIQRGGGLLTSFHLSPAEAETLAAVLSESAKRARARMHTRAAKHDRERSRAARTLLAAQLVRDGGR